MYPPPPPADPVRQALFQLLDDKRSISRSIRRDIFVHTCIVRCSTWISYPLVCDGITWTHAAFQIHLPPPLPCPSQSRLTRFIPHYSIFHDCSTALGQPTALGRLLAAPPIAARIRMHAVKAVAGAAVDPHTWEPVRQSSTSSLYSNNSGSSSSMASLYGGGENMQGGEKTTLLIESGLDVSMSLDLLRHASGAPAAGPQDSSQPTVLVVLSARPELSETLDVIAGRSGSVFVIGLQKDLYGTPLSQFVTGGITLDWLLVSAAEALLWHRRRCRQHLQQRQLQQQQRRQSLSPRADFCPHGPACDYLRGTAAYLSEGASQKIPLDGTVRTCAHWNEVNQSHRCSPAGGSGGGSGQTSPPPFSKSKLDHLTAFQHTCGAGRTCRNGGPYHQMAFPHVSSITSSSCSSSSCGHSKGRGLHHGNFREACTKRGSPAERQASHISHDECDRRHVCNHSSDRGNRGDFMGQVGGGPFRPAVASAAPCDRSAAITSVTELPEAITSVTEHPEGRDKGATREEDGWLEEAVRKDFYGEEGEVSQVTADEEEDEETAAVVGLRGCLPSVSKRSSNWGRAKQGEIGKPVWWQRLRRSHKDDEEEDGGEDGGRRLEEMAELEPGRDHRGEGDEERDAVLFPMSL